MASQWQCNMTVKATDGFVSTGREVKPAVKSVYLQIPSGGRVEGYGRPRADDVGLGDAGCNNEKTAK